MSKVDYDSVMRLLDRRLTDVWTISEARKTELFSAERVAHIMDYPQDFARGSAELAEYSGAMREIKLLMSYIEDMNES